MTALNLSNSNVCSLDQLNKLLQATNTLIQALSAASIRDDLLSDGISALATLIQARYGAISILSDNNIESVITHNITAGQHNCVGATPFTSELLNQMSHTLQPTRFNAPASESHLFDIERPVMNTLLVVPIATSSDLLGHIYLCNKENQTTFNDIDEQLVCNFASSLALVLDNIQQRQAKQKAEEQTRLHAKAFENCAEAVVIADSDGMAISINQTFTRMTGYALAEVNDSYPHLLTANRKPRSFYLQLCRELQEQGFWHGEMLYRRKHGETFPIWASLSAIKNSQGEISHYVVLLSDLSERKRFQEQIQYLACYDALTNLPNRALFIDRTRQLVANSKRSARQFALLSINIDQFKNINDTYGPAVGDKLFQKLARRLLRVIRDDDTAARLGGDKFCISVANLNRLEDAAVAAGNILDTLARPFKMNKKELYITASIGISCYPADGQDAITLIKHAEAAMFHAKSQQRNHFQFYRAEISASRSKRLRMEADLLHALDHNEFVLHYQPKICFSSWCINSVEALIRWQHPRQGLIGPNEFIPLLEECGLINQVGEWVLLNACAQINRWLDLGITPPTVAFHVSAQQFEKHDIIQTLSKMLEKHADCTRYLESESTESILMRAAPQASKIRHRIREMGVHISVDDFGTGYSSLAYLSSFPIDTLKIDRTFIQSVTENHHDATITRSVVDLAHSLGLRALAEGIETRAQLDFLTTLGCDAGQGFLFSRPVEVSVLTEQLRGTRSVNLAEYG